MKNFIPLILILAACGSNSGGGGNDSSEPTTKREETPLQSIALDDFSDLPSCESSNDKQLAYVTSEDQFYVCEEKDWQPIEIGSEGERGAKGDDGLDGEDGLTVTTNNWYDAVTDKNWLIGALGSYASAESNCISPWRLPTKDEALAASQRGLGVAASSINGPTTIWTSDEWNLNPTHNFIIENIATTPATNGAQRSTATRGIVCVEQ